MNQRFIDRCRELNRQRRWHRMLVDDDRSGAVWDRGRGGEHLVIGWEHPVLGGNVHTFARPHGSAGSAPVESFWLPRFTQMVELAAALGGRSEEAVLTDIAQRAHRGVDLDNAALDELERVLPAWTLGTPESLTHGPDPLADSNASAGRVALLQGVVAHQDGDPWRARSHFWVAEQCGFPEIAEAARLQGELARRSLPKSRSRRVRAASTVYREAIAAGGELRPAASAAQSLLRRRRADPAHDKSWRERLDAGDLATAAGEASLASL